MVAATDPDYDEVGTDLRTATTTEFSGDYDEPTAIIEGEEIKGYGRERTARVINTMLKEAEEEGRLDEEISEYSWKVVSENYFPTKAGLASSASGFAALVRSVDSALDLDYTQKELGRYARIGSGSAMGGLHDGIVYGHSPKYKEERAVPEQLASPDEIDLGMIVAVVSRDKKEVGSSAGHGSADTSRLHDGPVSKADRSDENAILMREAVLENNVELVGEIAEQDSELMHSVMRTSNPPLVYSQPETGIVKGKIMARRAEGKPIYFSQDAGPSLKVITTVENKKETKEFLDEIPEVEEAIPVVPGKGARELNKHLF